MIVGLTLAVTLVGSTKIACPNGGEIPMVLPNPRLLINGMGPPLPAILPPSNIVQPLSVVSSLIKDIVAIDGFPAKSTKEQSLLAIEEMLCRFVKDLEEEGSFW